MTTAISVKNIGKQYKIGAAETKFRYNMLRDVIVDTVSAPIRLAKAMIGKSDRRMNQNYVWALKDVSFDLEEGKVLGIVGRNGAGKSTLMKILSGVYGPDAGILEVHGDEARFASFLYTAGQPDPDLLIRTSGEMRVSNFLLWQISYAEIWVTPRRWPEFDIPTLHEALRDYAGRERRFGGLNPSGSGP